MQLERVRAFVFLRKIENVSGLLRNLQGTSLHPRMVNTMFSQQHLPERLANLDLFRGFLAYGQENTYLVTSLTDLVNKSASVRTIDPIDTKPT